MIQVYFQSQLMKHFKDRKLVDQVYPHKCFRIQIHNIQQFQAQNRKKNLKNLNMKQKYKKLKNKNKSQKHIKYQKLNKWMIIQQLSNKNRISKMNLNTLNTILNVKNCLIDMNIQILFLDNQLNKLSSD